MIETLQKLCELLTKDPLTVPEVARLLGSGDTSDSGRSPMRVTPHNPAFQQIEVSRKKGGDEPSTVLLVPAAAKNLTIGQLRAAYGAFHDLPRARYNSPNRVMFRPKAAKGSYSCTILVDVDADDAITDDTRVTSITVRRDVPAT